MDALRERAVSLGDIACLLEDQGKDEEALALQEERLKGNRQLRDLGGQASALRDIARIELGNMEVAAPKIAEACVLFDRIGRLEGICEVGMFYGGILVCGGKRDEGLAVLRRSEKGLRKLERPDMAEVVRKVIQQIEAQGAGGSGEG